jgi:glutathione S-transferase
MTIKLYDLALSDPDVRPSPFCWRAKFASERIEEALQTLAAPMVRHKFLGGESANMADYNMFSIFQWLRLTTQEELFETPQAVAAWQERMLDLFDGYARNAKRVS